MALEFEINQLRDFKKALPKERKRKAYEELIDTCRNNTMANGNACNPIVFEPMLMSILLFQQKRLWKLESKLNALMARHIGLKVVEVEKEQGFAGALGIPKILEI